MGEFTAVSHLALGSSRVSASWRMMSILFERRALACYTAQVIITRGLSRMVCRVSLCVHLCVCVEQSPTRAPELYCSVTSACLASRRMAAFRSLVKTYDGAPGGVVARCQCSHCWGLDSLPSQGANPHPPKKMTYGF